MRELSDDADSGGSSSPGGSSNGEEGETEEEKTGSEKKAEEASPSTREDHDSDYRGDEEVEDHGPRPTPEAEDPFHPRKSLASPKTTNTPEGPKTTLPLESAPSRSRGQ